MKTNKQTLRKEIAEILADYKYNDTKIETTEQVALFRQRKLLKK